MKKASPKGGAFICSQGIRPLFEQIGTKRCENLNETIYALCTPQGRSAIAVIRISGEKAKDALSLCFVPKAGAMIPRMLTYGYLREKDRILDEAMAVFLPAPGTYTREDIAELQIHGAPVCIHDVLQMLSRLPLGLRPANPGEFTRRAFENGRLNLSQAEAVMSLIGSESERAAQASLRELRGSVSSPVTAIVGHIVRGLASIEAGIDFPEDDWEQAANAEGFEALSRAHDAVNDLVASYRGGRLMREGVRIAIVGRTNVGKSSLLNALAGFERALVSDEEGTTRDVVEHAISLSGFAIRLFDTAGMRQSATALERRGIEIGSRQLDASDVVIFIVDGSQTLDCDDAEAAAKLSGSRVVAAINKSDLPQVVFDEDVLKLCPNAVAVCTLSAQGGYGVDKLIRTCLGALPDLSEQSECITNARHAEALMRAGESLGLSIAAYRDGIPADIAAIHARTALAALAEITGEALSDCVIEKIFSTFCIGK
jgi:tRNA modification GTPase